MCTLISVFWGLSTVIKPPTPVDELLRLETLRNLKILDTDPEERFDRFTRLAKKIFGTQIALVSLVDESRQWFKSRQGLDATETSREVSFCGHTILSDQIMIVGDAADDERFCDNPLVTGNPEIRFYAGCPLSAPNGQRVGTLCLIDNKPRGMTPDELQLLQQIGKMVEEELVIAEFLRVDPTTGLSNYAGFCDVSDHLVSLCARNRVPASLLLVHFSNLRLIDDSLGNATSDRAAIEMTQLLMATFRSSDCVGRLAPNLFGVLLAGAEHHDIDGIKGRLQTHIEERNRAAGAEYSIEIEPVSLKYKADEHANT
ncbi:MAG: GAF domain-containing protein, partial [Rhodothermales bacterium]|nr:GAF domain-containing protein [Rhodothermales bacterium]